MENWGRRLEPGGEFEVNQPRGESLWHSIGGIGEILDKQVWNGVFPVNQVKYFQWKPDVFQVAKRIMAPPVTFIIIQQQRTETDIRPYIRIYKQGVPVFDASRYIKRKVAAIQQAKVNLKIFIGGKVILNEHAEG